MLFPLVMLVPLLVLTLPTDPIVTQEYTDYLKRHVDWEVTDYEDNIFRGWTEEEFASLLGDDASDPGFIPEGAELPQEYGSLPASIDWVGQRCIHGVRTQGKCGACWAFSTATMVSDRCCLQAKDPGVLSVQELVSCDRTNNGCTGGMISRALVYVQKNGLAPEACYPYVERQEVCPLKCKSRTDWLQSHACKCKSIVDCGTLNGMMTCLQKGPIGVRMIVYKDLAAYHGGIYCWDGKSPQLGGHAVRCTGYGTTPKPNLMCANSWGIGWGIKGYFQIETRDGCGVRMTPHDAWTVEGC